MDKKAQKIALRSVCLNPKTEYSSLKAIKESKAIAKYEIVVFMSVAHINTIAITHQDFVLSLSSFKFAFGLIFPITKNKSDANVNSPKIRRTIKSK